MTKTNIFILSYSRLSQFFNEVEYDSRFNYFIINNNKNQVIRPAFACAHYTTNTNIGCAGGWNLIQRIAFDFIGLEKIIITQDDCKLKYNLLLQALNECSPNNIVGIIQPHFEFSCFAIHRDTYKKVGFFDENFINVYCEDADYKQRCRLLNINIDSLYINNRAMNDSATIKDNPSLNMLEYNKTYLNFKWGKSIHPAYSARVDNQPPFEYSSPFKSEYDNFPINYIPITKRITNIFGDIQNFPSEIEYDRFTVDGFSRFS